MDVVVVGGGAAGCVMAARLSESGERSVTLLEAGPDLRGSVPDALRDGWELCRDYDWGYVSEPDARGETQDLRRTRLLGGTSWMTRFAMRGSPADYDEWAARGNPGWDFESVLPYLNRLEADADFGDCPFHGDAGPMPVRRYLDVELTDACTAGLQALEAEGFARVYDHNEPGAVGAGRMPMTSTDGVRVTTSDAYLAGAAPNLTIRADAHVASVVFDGSRAVGVSLLDGDRIGADHLVLCAGTYASPAILMRSGIGPADHLRSAGVPVLVDLPGVGANLADHPAMTIDCGYRGTSRAAPVLHVVGTFHSATTPATEAPDLMLWICDPTGEPASFEIEVVLLRPRSRGSVRLRSADPADPPLISLPGLSDESDVARLAEGYVRGLELAGRPEIRRVCAAPPSPTPDADEDVAETVHAEMYSLPHVVGTCAMGADSDEGAVVDATGRVHGTEGLTVADASIIPDPPSGFTHIPTIMLAERLAEQIASSR